MKPTDIEISIVNGFHSILQRIKLIEALLKELFDRGDQSSGSSGRKWSFFDDIVVKYMGAASASEEGLPKGTSERLACALVVVCLCEYDDFVRFVFDIFVFANHPDSGGGDSMCMQDYADVLRTVLNVDESSFDDHAQAFSLYMSSHPLRQLQGRGRGDSAAEGLGHFPKTIAVHYHCKTHRQLLWPLQVAQEQVELKFLGVNFWSGLRRELAKCPEAASRLLPARADNFPSLVRTLLALTCAHHSVQKLPPPLPPASSASSPTPTGSSPASSPASASASQEIVSADGIYTYRHRMRRGSSSRVMVPLHPHSPIDQLLKDSSISTETRRFPLSELTLSKMSSPASSSDMGGLNMLIIEDSKLQRKMMRRQLSNTDSFSRDDSNSRGDSPGNGEPAVEDKCAPGGALLPPAPFSRLGEEEPRAAWSVHEASNGEEAIQMIIDTKSSFDVIFVDENLQHSGGNMLGHEFVTILRGHSSVLPSTVIVGCSGNAEVYVSDFLQAGADAVWQKPMPAPDVILSELCKYVATRTKCNQ